MNLAYSSPEETTIRVTLDEGETLDEFVGPTEVFVPVDPDNRHYQTIVDGNYTVDPYVAPSASPSAAIADSAQSLQMANAKSLAAQGRTDEALTALITIMEQST
jgi:hypothetical protein